MSQIVAIEFGTGFVRVAALAKMRKSWGLSVFVEREVPPASEKESFPEGPLVEAIGAILDEHKLPRDQVALVLPAHRCVFRYFTVDFTSDDAIKKTIKYAAEEHLPTTSIENVIVNYYKLATEKEKTHLLVSIVEKKLIKNALQVLESCRIDPLTVDIDLLAALNTYKRFDLLRKPSRILVVELGQRSSNVSLVVDGQLQFLRSPKLGIASLEADEAGEADDPLQNLDLAGDLADLQLDLADLEKDLVISISSLDEPGRPAAGEPAENLQQALEERRRQRFLDRLVKDLRRTVLTARKGAPEAIYLTGPGSHLPEVAEALEQTFGVPVSTPAITDRLSHRLDRAAAERCNALLPSVLGVGLKLLGMNESGAELRKEEFKFARKFEQIQGPLVTAVCLLFGIVLLFCYQMMEQLRVAQADYGDVLHEARQLVYNRQFHKDKKAEETSLTGVPLESRLARLQMELEDLLKAYGGTLEQREAGLRSGLDVWLDLFLGIKEFGRSYPDQLVLHKLAIKEDVVTLQGTVGSARIENALWDLVTATVKRQAYMDRAVNESRPDRDGTTQLVHYRILLKRIDE